MGNPKGGGEDRRRRLSDEQKEGRAKDRLCGWCQSPENVDLIHWRGRKPKEGEKPKEPLRIPICAVCKAQLGARWADGTALCGHCEMPTDKSVDWLGPNGPFGIVMCAECHARLNGAWRPEGDVCGHCAKEANDQIGWKGIPFHLPICSECKASLTDIQKQGEAPLWRRVWSWLMGD